MPSSRPRVGGFSTHEVGFTKGTAVGCSAPRLITELGVRKLDSPVLYCNVTRLFAYMLDKLTLEARFTLNHLVLFVECCLHSISFPRQETLRDTDHV